MGFIRLTTKENLVSLVLEIWGPSICSCVTGWYLGRKSLPKGKAFALHAQKPFLYLFWQMKFSVYFGINKN